MFTLRRGGAFEPGVKGFPLLMRSIISLIAFEKVSFWGTICAELKSKQRS